MQIYGGLRFEKGGHGRVLYTYRGSLYVALSHCLLCSTDGGATFEQIADFTFEPSVLSMYAPGRLLIGFRADGLYLLDIRTGEWSLVPMAADSPYDAAQFYPYAITRIDDEEFMVGSEWGLFRLHHGELIPMADKLSAEKRVDVVFDVCKDQNDGLWVANNFSGVHYFSYRQSMFECFASTGLPRSLTGNVVRAIAEDANGNLWIGTEDGGLCRFNSLTRDFDPVVSADGFDLSRINIQDLTLVGGDELAMGTYRGGLYLYNIETRQLRHYMDKADVLTVYKRYDHTLLFTTMGKVWLLDPRTNEGPRLCLEHGGTACALVEDHHGRIWLPLNNGLLCYNPADASTKSFTHDPADPTSLCAGRLSHILIDSRDRLWIASENNGMYCYDEQRDAFLRIKMEDGLPSDAVNTLVEDAEGNLWAGTSDGLALIDPHSRRVLAAYSTADGLVSKHITLKSARCLRSGCIAFGTFDGLVIANLVRKNLQRVPPPVTLTGLTIYNEEIRPQPSGSGRVSAILRASMPYTDAITLPSDCRTFTLSFSTFDFRHGEQGTFAYRLDGLDRQWNYVNNVGQVSYHNVPPGRYLFRIRSVSNQRMAIEGEAGCIRQSGVETQLAVCILAPWWKSKPMSILYLLLIASIVLLLLRLRAQRQKEKERMRRIEQNRENEKKLYQAKIDFFTNIAHEIRTPASLIYDPLHTLRKKGVPKDIDATLALVERNADSLNQLINELLDFRKVDVGIGEVEPRPEEFNLLVREVWESFRPSAENRGLHTQLSLPSVPLVANVDMAATKKILRNLFSNALKYAQSYIRIGVDAEAESDSVRLTLSNDGSRIPAEMRKKLFEPFVQIRDERLSTQGTGLGLPLARSLAERQGGCLYIDGEVSDNTFVLYLPLAEQLAEEVINPDHSEEQVDYEQPTDDSLSCVLVVEDNDDLRTYLVDCLSESYHVLDAGNGEEALEMLRKHEVQLVLSDVMMPCKDGLELCYDIKTDRTLCHIPVVLLTAKDTVADRVRGFEDGADVYIGKPFDMDQVKAQITSLLHNRKLLRDTFAHDPQSEPLLLAHTTEDERIIEKLNVCILEHIDDSDWNVDDLADKVGMSRSTLTRKIRALANQTPNEFVRLVRLRHAAALLRQGHYRLNEVCTMVGFSNPHYFSTLFQRQFGMKPSEYTQKMKK